MRDAILETRDELRWLNAKTDDLAIRQKRTHRWLIFFGAATAILTLCEALWPGVTRPPAHPWKDQRSG